MPNGAISAATVAASICCHRVFHCCCWSWWEAKGRWWKGEGGAKERGRVKAKGRPNRLMVEAAAAASWIDELGVSWIDKLGWRAGSE